MTFQTPPKLAEMMDKYDKEFQETFDGLHVNYFVGSLVLFGVADFDILKFEKYLQRLGYQVETDGSMKDYITKRWNKRASELISELIKAK